MAKKKTGAKAQAKAPAKPLAKSPAKTPTKAVPKTPAKAARLSWFDEKTHAPLIDSYARRLNSFIETMADGIVDDKEIAAQEDRLVGLMKEVEPTLDDAVHAKVTELLCELTAYDIIQMVHGLQKSAPKTRFRG